MLDCFGRRASHIEGPAPTLACADAEAHPVLGEEARRELAFGSGGNETQYSRSRPAANDIGLEPPLPAQLPVISIRA
jgi:hypothetical protein